MKQKELLLSQKIALAKEFLFALEQEKKSISDEYRQEVSRTIFPNIKKTHFLGGKKISYTYQNNQLKKLGSTQTFITVNSNPLGFGKFRIAYICQISNKDKRAVAKVHIERAKTAQEQKKNCLIDIETLAISNYYAKKFNENEFVTKKIFFVKTFLFKLTKPFNGISYLTVEQAIDGEFVKYNNNFGFVQKDCVTAQAFTHFSFAASEGQLMITDLQGAKVNKGGQYLLTDPAIHHTESEDLGSSNLGSTGFEKFFESHRCNTICNKLSISQSVSKSIKHSFQMETRAFQTTIKEVPLPSKEIPKPALNNGMSPDECKMAVRNCIGDISDKLLDILVYQSNYEPELAVDRYYNLGLDNEEVIKDFIAESRLSISPARNKK